MAEGTGERAAQGSRLYGSLSETVVGCAIAVHREMGPGLLEAIYERCLALELTHHGIGYRRQVRVPLRYRGHTIGSGYRMDFVVEERIVIEVKSIAALQPIHVAQLLTYLRLSGHRVGLLINFNVPLLKNGIRRLVL